MTRTTKKISTEEAAKQLNDAFDCMDDYRAKGLESTALVQDVKYNVKAREAKRLELKYGSNSPQAAKARAKISYAQTAQLGIKEQTARASVKRPRFERDSWRIQGRVVDTKFNGISDLTVSLFNHDGGWIRELGQACTDEKGFFVITFTDKNAGKDAERYKGQPLTLTVSDKEQLVLHQEEEPLFLELGKIDSRLIILGAEKCETPPETVPPEGGGTPGGTPGEVITRPIDSVDSWMVSGSIRDAATGEALRGLTVSLFDRDKLFADKLGKTATDENGNFTLIYSESNFKELFDENPSLYLRVMDDKGNTLYTSAQEIRSKKGEEQVFTINAVKR